MYIDPGVGGMLIQVLFVIAATGGALIFALRKKIKALFSKSGKKDEPAKQTKIDSANLDDDMIDILSDEKEPNEND